MTVHPRGRCRRCGSCLQAPFVRTETQAIVRRPPTADRRPPTARRIRTTRSAAGFVRDVGPDKSKKHKQKTQAKTKGAPNIVRGALGDGGERERAPCRGDRQAVAAGFGDF
ncbi:hypothetical protein [Burkholderia thailandensis]|uniref:hypothetical protein n=1 Tax=Burkholderia thailandensis TaxID=57975 RepID=UPI0013765C67|nr:hypothetical protein [Burkholderia thailandensis]NBD07203.1 hypothetical protein [Burkholderia thailandensis]WRS67745.1 hypothetical protein U9S59_24820 [Burkholderia thailandensis]